MLPTFPPGEAITRLGSRLAAPAPARGNGRRGFRNCGTDRTRRRPAIAARRRPQARKPSASRGGGGHCGIQRVADLVRDPAFERRGKLLCRLPDQIGFADTREELRERDDAAALRLAAGDPEDIGEGRQRFSAASALVPLESLTNSTLFLADLLHAMGEAGETAQTLLQNVAANAERQRRRRAHAAFCALCRPRSDPMPPISAIWLCAPPDARTILSRSTLMPSASGRFTDTRTTRLPDCSMTVRRRTAPDIVDADNRGALAAHRRSAAPSPLRSARCCHDDRDDLR